MNESYVRRKLLKVARSDFKLFAFPIESGLVHEGIPDVCFIKGNNTFWVELKYVNNFPKRSTTPVKADLLSEAQITWFSRYNEEEAGNGFILVRVMNAYFLFRSYWADKINDFVEKDYYVKCMICGSAKNIGTLLATISFIVNKKIALGPTTYQIGQAKESFNSRLPEGMF